MYGFPCQRTAPRTTYSVTDQRGQRPTRRPSGCRPGLGATPRNRCSLGTPYCCRTPRAWRLGGGRCMTAVPGRPRVFISYRRADTLASTRSIFERLAERFGDDQIFYDIDTLMPGVDFRQVIADALDRSDVVLAIIGPHWFE